MAVILAGKRALGGGGKSRDVAWGGRIKKAGTMPIVPAETCAPQARREQRVYCRAELPPLR